MMYFPVMIVFENVTITNRGHKLFEDLNLVIESQRHYLISGKNGSGKTTLLQALAGVLHPTTGSIRYDFIDPHLSWDDRYLLRKNFIHIVPTHALRSVLTTHPEFFYQQRYYTIGDVQLPTVQDFLGGERTKFDHSLFPASFNIDRLLPLELTRLSNGQLKKVLIVRELMRNIPKILLLDYPLDGLDSQSRSEFCDFIDHLARTFSIQIIMTDQGDEFPAVINRKILLDDFKIQSIQEVATKPKADRTITSSISIGNAQGGNDPVVEMQDVQIKYGEHLVISDLQWKIFKGDRWALTGRNGSGKTTLFSLIFADHPMAYSQKVFLFGKRRGSGESIWDIKRRISYLGPEQLHYFNTQLNGKTGRQFLLDDGDVNATDHLIAYFDAHSFIASRIQHYSSGQLQLLLLMKSFLSSKELLLLDEPFQFLDSVTKARVNLFLTMHLKASVTMILITHDVRDVEHWTQSRLHLSS